MFETILVPLDGSPAAEAVMPALRDFVGDAPGEWTVLRVVNLHIGPESPGMVSGLAEARAEAERYVRETVETLRRDRICATGRVVEATPAAAIVEAAADADLIAMCTHGRTGASRWVFGSVTEEVLRETPVPMFVVRASVRAARANHILVPIDRPDESRDLLATVARLARRGARLTLLHVGERAAETMEAAREILGTLPAPVDAVRPHPAPDPAAAILDECARRRCGMIAMCTHGRRGVARLVLGSCAESVMRQTEVPVLIVRRTPAEAHADRFRPA